MTDRKCHADGCDSGARWRVLVHLDCPGAGIMRKISTESSIEVCDAHKDEAKVKAYVRSDHNREIITTKFSDAGIPEPDWLSGVKVEFLPIERPRVVVPITCDCDGCDAPAKWQTVQVIPEIGRKKPRIRATTNICVCEEHKRVVTPAHFLEAEERKITFEYLQKQGVLLPDLDRMTIEFIPLLGARAVAAVITGD